MDSGAVGEFALRREGGGELCSMSVALGKRFCRDMLPAKRGEVYEEVVLNSEIARKLCELRIKAGLRTGDPITR